MSSGQFFFAILAEDEARATASPSRTKLRINPVAGRGDFPPLLRADGKRRTWRMVKLDLERVGIAYETADGIADFHAAGRHTHITELLRNGASLAEAKELARHSDIKMTMRYTHIGINDQAKALKQLPGSRP